MAVTKAVPREQLMEYFDEFTKRFLRLEFEIEAGDHRIIEPAEVWAVEEEDGFVSAVEVVHSDGAREVVSVKRVGLRALTHEHGGQGQTQSRSRSRKRPFE